MFNSNGNGGYSLADIAAVSDGNGNNSGWGFGNGGAWWVIVLFLFALGGWGGNGFGWGGNGGFNGAAAQGALTRSDLAQETNFTRLADAVSAVRQHQYDNFYQTSNLISNLQATQTNQFNDVNRGITDVAYAMQGGFNTANLANLQNTHAITDQLNNNATATLMSFNDVTNQMNRNFCDTNYNMATQANASMVANSNNTRDIIDNQNANTRSILEFLTQDKIDTLQSENQALRLAASQARQNEYLVDTLRPSPVPAYPVPNPWSGYLYGAYGLNG